MGLGCCQRLAGNGPDEGTQLNADQAFDLKAVKLGRSISVEKNQTWNGVIENQNQTGIQLNLQGLQPWLFSHNNNECQGEWRIIFRTTGKSHRVKDI